MALTARSREQVDEFRRLLIAAGFCDGGRPGLRDRYPPGHCGAFVLDPDGNSIEALDEQGARTVGSIDHVWLRVRAVGAARRFYEQTAPVLGFEAADGGTECADFAVATARAPDVTKATRPPAAR